MHYHSKLTQREGKKRGASSMAFEGLDAFSWNPEEGNEELMEKLGEAQDANNPERAVIRRDLFRRLSDEAVEVFDVVMNVPSELLSIIAGKGSHRRLTQSDIKRYMRREKGWPHDLIDGSLAELRALAESFSG